MQGERKQAEVRNRRHLCDRSAWQGNGRLGGGSGREPRHTCGTAGAALARPGAALRFPLRSRPGAATALPPPLPPPGPGERRRSPGPCPMRGSRRSGPAAAPAPPASPAPPRDSRGRPAAGTADTPRPNFVPLRAGSGGSARQPRSAPRRARSRPASPADTRPRYLPLAASSLPSPSGSSSSSAAGPQQQQRRLRIPGSGSGCRPGCVRGAAGQPAGGGCCRRAVTRPRCQRRGGSDPRPGPRRRHREGRPEYS